MNEDKRDVAWCSSSLNKIQKYYLDLKRESDKYKSFKLFSLDARDLDIIEGIEYGGNEAKKAAHIEEGRKLFLEQIEQEKKQLCKAKEKIEKARSSKDITLLDEASEMLKEIIEVRQEIIDAKEKIFTNVVFSLEVD